MGLDSVAVPPKVDLLRLLQTESGNTDDARQNTTTAAAADSSANIFGTYERGCHFSNDPGAYDDSHTPTDLLLCNVTSYLCHDTDPTPVEVLFDYEIRYNPDADLQTVLEYFEEVSLEHLSTKMGLRNCTAFFASSSALGSGRRRLGEEGGRGAAGSRTLSTGGQQPLVGLSVHPRDEPDEQHKNCIIPVNSSVEASSVCVPTKGALTAYVKRGTDGSAMSTSEATALRELIIKVIERGMDEDLYVTKTSIEKLSFVGNRTARDAASSEESATSPNQAQSSSANSQATSRGLAPGMFGLIAAVLLLVLIVLVAFMLVARRRKKERSDRGLDNANEISTIPPDWQVPADLGLGTPAQGALAVRDSLALRPQDFTSWPGDDDNYTANSLYSPGATGYPPRLLMSPSGGELPLKPPSQFTSRRSLTSFDSTFPGTDTVCSDLTNNDQASMARSLCAVPDQELHVASHGAERRSNGVYYIEPRASLGSGSYAADDADIPDSGSERSARRALQMT